ncbi:putative zinc finger protein [Orchesella cincta]|uniref:Putative zinc finger protein n=1 Tax=Orchesella cincta TaxID=48709 RepID=A0A1D2M8S2_ORCCI|nr:putative zinc finger protein [Orchesella cincta]
MKERRKLKAVKKRTVTSPSAVVEVAMESEPVIPEVSEAVDGVELEINCGECGMQFNHTDYRRATDNCGHVKCLKCLQKSNDCCATCEEKGKEDNKPKPSSLSPVGPLFKVPQRPPPHRCTHCDKRFELKWNLEVHLNDTHDIEVYHACNRCHRTFTYEVDFERHMRIHDAQLYKCSICPAAFRRKDNLQRHLINLHKMSKEDIRELAMRAPEY